MRACCATKSGLDTDMMLSWGLAEIHRDMARGEEGKKRKELDEEGGEEHQAHRVRGREERSSSGSLTLRGSHHTAQHSPRSATPARTPVAPPEPSSSTTVSLIVHSPSSTQMRTGR